MTTEQVRDIQLIDDKEIENATREETELHSFHFDRARIYKWVAVGLGAMLALSEFNNVHLASKVTTLAETKQVRFVAFGPDGQSSTFLSNDSGFDVKAGFVRDVTRQTLHKWAEWRFSRIRDPQLGPTMAPYYNMSYMFMGEEIMRKLVGKDNAEKRVDTFMNSGSEQIRIEPLVTLETYEQKVPNGPATGTAKIHMTETIFDASSQQTGRRTMVTSVSFTCDPNFLNKLDTMNVQQAENLRRNNALVLAVTSFTEPEPE